MLKNFSFPSFLWIDHNCSFAGSAGGNHKTSTSEKVILKTFQKGLFQGHQRLKRLIIRDYKKILKPFSLIWIKIIFLLFGVLMGTEDLHQ
jgi:hypothetical protein